jgi:hypothetical protein
MGDYELDYMGSAEFEFGAIPEANNRLAKAGKGLRLSVGENRYMDRPLDFLWINDEGDPFDVWCLWASGSERRPEWWAGYKPRPFEGKERPYDFEKKLRGEDYKYGGDVWWALGANVMWAFNDGDDGHLLKMLSSMGSAPTEFLR